MEDPATGPPPPPPSPGRYVDGMRMPISLVIAATVIGVLAPTAASGTAQANTRFTSCDQMHRTYEYGVAKDKASQDRAVRAGMYKPALKPQVYSASYKSLDRDKDGVMCEVPR